MELLSIPPPKKLSAFCLTGHYLSLVFRITNDQKKYTEFQVSKYMLPIQIRSSPEVWMILLLFVIVSVPVFIGTVILINRAAPDSRSKEVEELKERVNELESENK